MSTQVKQVTDGNPDGCTIGQGAGDRISFFNNVPIPQRANATQALIQGVPMGQVITYNTTQSPASVLANTQVEQTFTVTGLLTTDMVLAFNRGAAMQAGLGVTNARISAANTLALTWVNNTAANLTPTASEVYQVTVIRGLTTFSQTLTPAAVPSNTTSEQIFTVTGSGALAANAVVNTAGQVTAVNLATGNTGGTGYYIPPKVTIICPLNMGNGAIAIPILNSSGAIIGFQVIAGGQNYSNVTANLPTVTISGGGNGLALGRMVFATKPTAQAGLGIGGVRIVANGQIGITYVNSSGAAITPTSEAYLFFVCDEMPSIGLGAVYGVNVPSATVSTVTYSTVAKQITVTGLAANDVCVSVVKPSVTAGLFPAGGYVSAANTLQIVMANVTASTITPAGAEQYVVTVLKQVPSIPMQLYQQTLTPVSIAANTTAEQTFTVTGLPASSVVVVNKPSQQTGLAIVSARVSALNTLALSFANMTAAAIVPTAESYTIANFTAPGPGAEGYISLPVSSVLNQLVDLANELEVDHNMYGIVRGF